MRQLTFPNVNALCNFYSPMGLLNQDQLSDSDWRAEGWESIA